MKPGDVLELRAGPRALAHVRSHGLRAQDVEVIPGAAGGPKGLGLAGLDLALFGHWLPAAPRVRHLVGSSVGAWRFAAAAQPDPVTALKRFAKAYAGQRYPKNPSRAYIMEVCRALVAEVLNGASTEILASENYRLNLLAVRGRGPLAREKAHAPIGFALAAIANTLSRERLKHFFVRTLFHDPRATPPFVPQDSFATDVVRLGEHNLADALLASGAIPLVLEGVTGISGAPEGVYWDGGIIDYHLHLPFDRLDGLVLYPHFADHIVPGWLDKGLPWRRARGPWLDNVLLVTPSRAYVDRLPNRRLPTRKDFKGYGLDHDSRIRDWTRAIDESERLGEAFLQLAASADIADAIRPL